MDATAILSPTDDQNFAETCRLASLYEFPDFVKKAGSDALRPKMTAKNACADPDNLRYFCGNKPAAWLSALFFAEKRGFLDPQVAAKVEPKLEKLLAYWGLHGEYQKIAARYKELHKEAELSDGDFAYVWKDDRDGTVTRRCPMRSAMETKRAAAYLHEYRDIFPFNIRHTMATKIAVKVAHFGASLGEFDQFIERQAGRGTCVPSKVASLIRDRAHLAIEPAAKAGLIKLAETVGSRPRMFLEPDRVLKLAELIDDFDRHVLKLNGRYTSRIPRPEDVLFETTFKEAKADFEKVCRLSTGLIYDKSDFTRVDPQDLSELFGESFAGDCMHGLNIDPEKLAEQAAVLPVPDAEAFSKLLEENGIQPTFQEKGAAVRFTSNQLAAVAASY